MKRRQPVRLLTLLMLVTSCSIPGIRPEGQSQGVSSSAPESRGPVFQRAAAWFTQNGYNVTKQVQAISLSGFKVLSRDGDVETRSVVEFTIFKWSPTASYFTVQSHTEQGVPPNFSTTPFNYPEAQSAPGLLTAWLSCPAARWAACP